MTHLLLFLFLLACLGVGASWIAENPGEVVIHWTGYHVEASLAVIIGAMLVATLVLIIAYALLARLLGLPSSWAQRRGLKQYKNGLAELTWGVAALAASDIVTAERHTKKAEKWLGATPMTLLLSAQIARHQGDENKTQLLLENMLEHPQTEHLAARMLSESAGKQQLFPRALALAQRAHAASPHDMDAGLSLIGLHVKMAQWNEALQVLDVSARKSGLARSQRAHLRGIILLSQAKALIEDGQDDAALAIARKSLKLLPDFPPALMLIAQCLHELGATPKAVKLLLAAWRRAPNPQIGEMLRALTLGDAPKKRDKILEMLDSALIDERILWRCCACGEPSAQWQAHCPACDAFDTLQSTL